MKKGKQKRPSRICFECTHYEACQAWNVGTLVETDATHCVNYRASVGKTNADRLRSMSDEDGKACSPLIWISIYDKLPPAEKEVYVTDGEYIARANLLDEVFPGDKPCWSYSGLGEITHWCERIPLPQPAEEGE